MNLSCFRNDSLLHIVRAGLDNAYREGNIPGLLIQLCIFRLTNKAFLALCEWYVRDHDHIQRELTLEFDDSWFRHVLVWPWPKESEKTDEIMTFARVQENYATPCPDKNCVLPKHLFAECTDGGKIVATDVCVHDYSWTERVYMYLREDIDDISHIYFFNRPDCFNRLNLLHFREFNTVLMICKDAMARRDSTLVDTAIAWADALSYRLRWMKTDATRQPSLNEQRMATLLKIIACRDIDYEFNSSEEDDSDDSDY
jgi:hypothetical protein